MFDLKVIRDDPAAFDAGLARRGHAAVSTQLLDLDARRRALITANEQALARRNAASKEIGQAMAAGDRNRAEALKAEVAELKQSLPEAEAEEKSVEAAIEALMGGLPNLAAADVPDGVDENDNVEVRRWGTPPAVDFAIRDHQSLGEAFAAGPLAGMDFPRAARLSGARFSILAGPIARLERALGQFMLDRQVGQFGYTEVQTPVMVQAHVLHGTSQLPKFADDLYSTGEHWLIPTAEVTLTSLLAGEIIDEEALPLRFTALTPCFRAEAGSAGRDTRGMMRQHQFNKVEMVAITTPEQAAAEHERMTACAEQILKALELPFRTMLLCTGDMGFQSAKTYDLEVWLPSEERYREISSCSVCGDFQARRMKMRCRPHNEKKTRFVHTLNGSGLAVGRTLIAVMENYQRADGSIEIPQALRPYMQGLEAISP